MRAPFRARPTSPPYPPTDQALSRAPALSLPPVVAWLIGIMVAVFLLQMIMPALFLRSFDVLLGFMPARFTAGIEQGGNPFALAVPLFGHLFLHGGLMHIASNVVWMAVFGTGVARRMDVERGTSGQVLARNVVFLTFFFLCGAAGGLAYYALNPNSPVFLVGASGAISGLMGGAIRFVGRPRAWHGGEAPLTTLNSRPVIVMTIVYIGMNLLIAFSGDRASDVSIAWEAHIGGFLAGLLAFPLFDMLSRRV